ncbi:MAG: B12-binding domain-containing radical SAM protein [Myxococcota bacterium]
MKILIVQPTYYTDPHQTQLHKTPTRSLVGLTLPYLAALTPPEWEVELLDEQVQTIDFQADVDLVAITTWTVNSVRAYHIAKRFRDRGIKVIMGGPHTFFHSDEALEHCDAVGIGEGEFIWANMLKDAAAGRLKRMYRAGEEHHLQGLPLPRYDLMKIGPKWDPTRTYSVQASRGCPFKCEFCSERFFVGTKYRYRPVQDLVDEIKQIGATNVFFADSMFAGKKEHTKELMEALIPLKITWSTLWTTYLCKDEAFLDLAKRSGLIHVNMGMESINQETLKSMNKRHNKVHEYNELLGNLSKRGISYSLNFVFGWEGETPDVFDTTLNFLQENKVPVAYFYILSPHKGTPLFDRMMQQGKVIVDERLIRRTPGIRCDIKPPHGTPEEMENRVRDMYDKFYSTRSMMRRLPPPTTKSHVASWMLNVAQRRMRRTDRILQNHDWT